MSKEKIWICYKSNDNPNTYESVQVNSMKEAIEYKYEKLPYSVLYMDRNNQWIKI